MARFAAQLLQGTVSTAYKSLGNLVNSSASARRLLVYEFDVGMSGALNTTTDTQVLFDVSRFTTTSLLAGTAFTPNPLDPADAATLATFYNAITTEIVAGGYPAAGSG